jgi:hypothetical protein
MFIIAKLKNRSWSINVRIQFLILLIVEKERSHVAEVKGIERAIFN